MVTQAAADAHDDDDCLCQGTVPAASRIDFEQRIQDAKTGKWKWKVMLRYHRDCDIHGIKVTEDASRP